MERLEIIRRERKIKGLTWNQLAEELPIDGNSLRIAFSRNKVDPIYLDVVEKKLEIGNNKLNVQANESDASFMTKAGSKYEDLMNGRYKLTVPFVPVRAQARYASEFNDAEFISNLTEVSFIVDRVGNGRYLAFEIQNDSMDDDSKRSIPDGAIVLGRELGKHHWKNKFRTTEFPYWIIVHENGMLCKEIVNHDVENGIITCHSLNDSPEYADFDFNLDEVHQLFNIVKKQL